MAGAKHAGTHDAQPHPAAEVAARATQPNGEVVVVHSSDLHVDPGFRPNPELDDLWPLRQVLQAAEAVAAHVVLLAGDVFEHNRMPDALAERAARLLADAPRAIVILPGNHDPLTPDSVYRRGGLAEPANVTVLGLPADAVVFPALELEIWGHAHRDYNDMAPLRDPRPRTTRWQIATAHGHFDDGPYPPDRFRASWLFWEHDIAATGADYVALGHWNTPTRVGNGSVPAYYSGAPDYARTVNVIRFGPSSVAIVREPIPAARDPLP
jgi:DNA repair exonuclease SbcCD nuclease subunit